MLAAAEERIVVTLDADFSALLSLSDAVQPSVVHLRIEGLASVEAAGTISMVVSGFEDDLVAGCIVSVTLGGIRVRRLPVRPTR